jgi:hypothetical protein
LDNPQTTTIDVDLSISVIKVLTEKLLPRVVDPLFEDHVIEILVSLETSP